MRGNNWRLHTNTYARLVANVVEDGECWLGQEKDTANYGYPRISFIVPGLGGRHVNLLAHIVMFCLVELRKLDVDDPSIDELWLAYQEFRESGLEIDHTCNDVQCRHPGHLDPCTRRENEERKHARRVVRENIELEEAGF